jgi:hypothetical protein
MNLLDPFTAPKYQPHLHLPWLKLIGVMVAVFVASAIGASLKGLPRLERVPQAAMVEALALGFAGAVDYYLFYLPWVWRWRRQLDDAGFWVSALLVIGALTSVFFAFWAALFGIAGIYYAVS